MFPIKLSAKLKKIMCVCLGIIFVCQAQTREAYALSLDETDKEFAIAVCQLLNKERTARGLKPVTLDFSMCLPAKQRANECTYNDMGSAETAHKRPDGRNFGTVFAEFNISGFSLAFENLAFTNEVNLNAKRFIDSWMESTTGHREAMLNADITVVGVGQALSGPGSVVAGKVYTEGCRFACLLMTYGYSAQEPYNASQATSTPAPDIGDPLNPDPLALPDSTPAFMSPTPAAVNSTPKPTKTPEPTPKPPHWASATPTPTPVNTAPIIPNGVASIIPNKEDIHSPGLWCYDCKEDAHAIDFKGYTLTCD